MFVLLFHQGALLMSTILHMLRDKYAAFVCCMWLYIVWICYILYFSAKTYYISLRLLAISSLLLCRGFSPVGCYHFVSWHAVFLIYAEIILCTFLNFIVITYDRVTICLYLYRMVVLNFWYVRLGKWFFFSPPCWWIYRTR